MKIPTLGKLAVAALISTACIALWGCPNPNSIGVQTYGVISVTCLQASNNQPVGGALASASGDSANASSSGVAILNMVPIGTDIVVHCDAPGLTGTSTVPSLTAANTATSPATTSVLMSPS